MLRFREGNPVRPNGLVERANRSLGEGIKARLDERSKDWIEELPHVLWAHRTMIKSSNGETPFSLTEKKKGARTSKSRGKRRKRWKNITTQESAAQVSSRATWSTATMKQVMPGMKANLDPSGKDHMKLKSRLEKEHINSKTAKEMKYRGHGTFVISKEVYILEVLRIRRQQMMLSGGLSSLFILIL
ncbi:reverse transcriptase domain-containing protein [Tanacetum coccineum]